MEEKIKLYEEMLALDPGSKLFFSLAKLYRQNSEPQKAVSTLYSGLEKHPEHLEARLLLLKLLIEQGLEEEVQDTLTAVKSILESYHDFWFTWANRLENEGKIDLALALRFIGYNLSGREVTWSDIFYMGLNNLIETGSSEPGNDQNQFVQDNEVEDDETSEEQTFYMEEANQLAKTGEEQYRTKTMADILADQGDYEEAIDIYEELYQNTRDEEEKKKLKQIIDGIKGESSEEDSKDHVQEKKQKIVQRMSSLAKRLEARGV